MSSVCVERVCVLLSVYTSKVYILVGCVLLVTDEALDGSVGQVEDDVLTHTVIAARLHSTIDDERTEGEGTRDTRGIVWSLDEARRWRLGL